jgi:hypothetical protein
MRTIKVAAVAVVLLGCKPKGDREQQCHDVVEHMRKVSMMPMRDGDVRMLMGACEMWSEPLLGCYMATKNDDDIKKCRDMER